MTVPAKPSSPGHRGEVNAGRLPDLDTLGRRFAPYPTAIPDITVEGGAAPSL
jgi:hypothetical protein